MYICCKFINKISFIFTFEDIYSKDIHVGGVRKDAPPPPTVVLYYYRRLILLHIISLKETQRKKLELVSIMIMTILILVLLIILKQFQYAYYDSFKFDVELYTFNLYYYYNVISTFWTITRLFTCLALHLTII